MRKGIVRAAWLFYFTFVFFLLVIPVANAYLDPGSGSVIFQAIVGGAMAAALGVKVFWRRIVAFFSRKRSHDRS